MSRSGAGATGAGLLFRDMRKFGRLGLYRRDEAGPILGADDAGRAVRRARPRAARRRLHAAGVPRPHPAHGGGASSRPLTDQGFLAGVGNIYADEALWRVEAPPASRPRRACGRPTSAGSTGASGASSPRPSTRRGSSVDDYTAPEGDGEMQEHLDVYQRTGLPCHRCGRPIRRLVLAQRGTHFCSWCQRLPAVAAGRHEREAGTRARRSARPTRPPLVASCRRATGVDRGTGQGRLVSILRLEGVRREIGDFVILDSVSAAMARGERVGLVGGQRRRQDDAAAHRGGPRGA